MRLGRCPILLSNPMNIVLHIALSLRVLPLSCIFCTFAYRSSSTLNPVGQALEAVAYGFRARGIIDSLPNASAFPSAALSQRLAQGIDIRSTEKGRVCAKNLPAVPTTPPAVFETPPVRLPNCDETKLVTIYNDRRFRTVEVTLFAAP